MTANSPSAFSGFQQPTLLNRISTRLYGGIAVAVVLTIAASVVGWISFQRIDAAEQELYDSSITQMEAAFAITQYTGELVASASRLAAAPSELYQTISDEVNVAKRNFQDQLDQLVGLANDEDQASRLRTIRLHSNTIILNLSTISAHLPIYYQLDEDIGQMKDETDLLYADLQRLIDDAIDNQFFYMMTGYRSIDTDPDAFETRLADDELIEYRVLRLLKTDVDRAYGQIINAVVADVLLTIEGLHESFEIAINRIFTHLQAVSDQNLADEVGAIIDVLAPMTTFEEGIFGAAHSKIEILERQRTSLDQNIDAEQRLVSEVTQYAASAQAAAAEAAAKSADAIRTGRVLLVVISVLGVVGAAAISWMYIGRLLLRRLSRLSDRMRALAAGDLESEVVVTGRDEVADMAAALEVFRQDALEVQRLNLVEQLAQELGERNEQLESAMGELNRAQSQIVAREKLAALGEVTAGVAHEIRNPLNFIKNFSEASEELLDELLEAIEESINELDEDDRDYVDEINGDLVDNFKRIIFHSSRANRIVEDMLRMGRGVGEMQSTAINVLVRDHAMLAYHSARATDADYVVDIEEDFDPDAGELQVVSQDLGRVFLNLVSNAGYAANQKYIEAKQSDESDGFRPTVRIRTRRTADKVTVSVWDNGSGIDEDTVGKIFEPFFTTKPTDKGTGLGLAMSNDIVRSHGGTLTVQSTPGEQTEFVVSLPLDPPAATASQ